MAIFTDSIMEILQRNSNGQDITTFEGMMNVGAPIFFGEEMNFISEEYREKFELGFLLKFFYKELAFDALPAWRVAFKQKIVNNAEYINALYGTLDKQVISEYKIRKVKNVGTSKMVTDVEGYSANSSQSQRNAEHEGTAAEANSDVKSSTGISADSNSSVNSSVGNSSNLKTGDDTTVNAESKSGFSSSTKNNTSDPLKNYDEKKLTGEEINEREKNSSDVKNIIGSEKDTYNTTNTSDKQNVSAGSIGGRDNTHNKHEIEGTEVVVENRNLTQEEKGGYKDATHNKDTDKNNSFQINYDAPGNSISNMRWGPGAEYIQAHEAGPTTGTGSDMISSAEMKYMSSAAEGGISDDSTKDGYSIRSFGEYDANGNKIANTKYEKTDKGPVKTTTVYGGVDAESGFQPLARYDEDNGYTQYGRTDSKSDIESGTDRHTGSDTHEYIDRVDSAANSEVERDVKSYNNYSDKDSHSVDTTETNDSDDASSSSSSNVVSYNTQDNESHSDENVSSSVRQSNTENVENSSGSKSSVNSSNDSDVEVKSDAGTNKSNTDQTGASTNDTDEEEYTYNMELIYRSISLLDKVWDLFYDLFQFIYE